MTTARATTPAVHIFPLSGDSPGQELLELNGSPRLKLRSRQKLFSQQQSTLGKYIHDSQKSSQDLDRLGRKANSVNRHLGAIRQGADLSPVRTSARIGYTMPSFKGFRYGTNSNINGSGAQQDTVKFEPHEVKTEAELKRQITWEI